MKRGAGDAGQENGMKLALKIVLPVLVLLAGVLAARKMTLSRAPVEIREPEAMIPVIQAIEVQPETVRLWVKAHGTVVPRTESVLAPEIAGRIIYASPSLRSGGFFEEGDRLVQLDSTDYELAAIQARSAVAQAQLQLEQEQAEAAIALREWKSLGEGEASSLLRREPQLAQARAALEAARAASQQSERNLDRTEILAPFAGRVRRKQVDLGQFVTAGTPLAIIYSVDVAEIRLPLPDEELAFVSLPLNYRGDNQPAPRPRVIIRSRFAGSEHTWMGRIVRTEGEIDPRTRVVHAIAQVENPYGRGKDSTRPPLAIGMFVEAEIRGHLVENIFQIPRVALRGKDRVVVVDEENRLRFRQVEVLRSEDDKVLISKGLKAGERVSVAILESVVDGMQVQVLEEAEDPALHMTLGEQE